jgi:hypothetical protein
LVAEAPRWWYRIFTSSSISFLLQAKIPHLAI